LRRRSFFGKASAFLFAPAISAAQETTPPDCIDSLDLAPGVRAISALRTAGAIDDPTRPVRKDYGTLRITVGYRAERSDAVEPSRRTFYLTLTQPPGGGATRIALWTSAMRCPTNSCDEAAVLQLRLMVDKQAFARLRLRMGDVRDLRAPLRALILSEDQERTLRRGRSMWLEVATRSGWERGEFRIRDLDDWLKAAEAYHRTRLRRALSEGAVCRNDPVADVSPCYMTTLICHRLGRGASAFELRQMNKLQPRFAAYSDHIEAYVTSAMVIGDRAGERPIRQALAVFYVLFIWPAAILIALRAIWPGALWYFAGFNLVKLLHHVFPAKANAQ